MSADSASCALVAACRDGGEFSALSTATTPLQRVYESFGLRLVLTRATDQQERHLAAVLQVDVGREYPTLGSICMHDAFALMQGRFEALPTLTQQCFRAIQLLAGCGIEPVTHRRIEGVLSTVFDISLDKLVLRDHLASLARHSFLLSAEGADPVIPEAAYTTGPDVESFYLPRTGIADDAPLLERALAGLEDLRGLNSLAFWHYVSGRIDDAARIWSAVVEELGERVDYPEEVARALFNLGYVHGAQGRPDEGVACYREVVRRFGEAPEAALREQVAKALVNESVAHRAQGRPDEAVACYREVVRRFGEAPEAALREQVAKALVNEGVAHRAQGRPDEAVACYREVVRRFGEAPEAALREQVAKALFNEGVTHGEQGRPDEEVARYREIVRRFGEAPETALREIVDRARAAIEASSAPTQPS